jgi:predicted porin
MNALAFRSGLVGALAVAAWMYGMPAQADDGPLVECVSSDGERQHCAGYTMSGVALRRSIGSAACLLGRNWGYDDDGVWVTEGCGGQFVLGNPAAEQQRVAGVSPDQATLVQVEDASGSFGGPGSYEAYTRFGTQTAVTGGDAQVEDASSRLGFRYEFGGPVRLFAGAEWAVNLTGRRSDFNAGNATSGNFVQLEAFSDELLSNRLGYVGVDFGDFGRLTLGKQWGVHYDVTSYTDAFNVFGANASATFVAGTDGGLTGTGRADSALSYRNTLFGKLDLGLQVQMRGAAGGGVIDGFGGSLQAHVLPGLTVGATYSRARYAEAIKDQVRGLRGDGEFGAVGVRYEADRLSLSGVYARQRNGDLARLPVFNGPVLVYIHESFDASGIELFGRYQLGRVGLLGGYLNYRPDLREDSLINPAAETQYVVTGVDYAANRNALLFAEYRFSQGVGFSGEPGDDVFALGFKYWFRKRGDFQLD